MAKLIDVNQVQALMCESFCLFLLPETYVYLRRMGYSSHLFKILEERCVDDL